MKTGSQRISSQLLQIRPLSLCKTWAGSKLRILKRTSGSLMAFPTKNIELRLAISCLKPSNLEVPCWTVARTWRYKQKSKISTKHIHNFHSEVLKISTTPETKFPYQETRLQT